MHPYLMEEMARLRHDELLRDAEQARRARSICSLARSGGGLWHRVKAAAGNRMVATGWRLLEAGLPHTR
ncbi:MAG TPA: hypothetical protein VKI20_07765 [Acidimicrobiales bacterium]|nr:hypothetical protein [Acidimicrobiales bacterium]